MCSIIHAQYRCLSQCIQTASTQDDLEQVQRTLDVVGPTWSAAGEQTRLVGLRRKLKQRASRMLLNAQDQLALYQPGRGLWQSARQTVMGLARLVSN